MKDEWYEAKESGRWGHRHACLPSFFFKFFIDWPSDLFRSFLFAEDIALKTLLLAECINASAALAGNRTQVNCLEGSYAHHYTTNAP